jgi:hypothetical protein
MLARDWLYLGLGVGSERTTRALKLYASDQVKRGQGLAASWAIAAGLLVMAALSGLGIIIVGFIALFSLLRLHFGLFESFGAVTGVLFVLVLLLCGGTVWLVRRPTRHIPSLTSRLRVATYSLLPAPAGVDTQTATIQPSVRPALLFAAAAIVLATAAFGRR